MATTCSAHNLNDPGQIFAEEDKDIGTAGRGFRHDLVKEPIQYPSVNDSIEARLDFVLNANASLLTVDVMGDRVTYQASQKINPEGRLGVLLLRDNDLASSTNSTVSLSPLLQRSPKRQWLKRFYLASLVSRFSNDVSSSGSAVDGP